MQIAECRLQIFSAVRISIVQFAMCNASSATIALTAVAAFLSLATFSAQQSSRAIGGTVTSFYDLKTRTLQGQPADLGQYRGSVTLVVNVASQCGYTPQYEGLEKLYREMKGKGVNVLGFPSNDFGAQEPGTPEEIQTFCKLNYGVTFPLFEKVVTQPGAGQSPVYTFLGSSGKLPAWNFSKYVIDRHGKIVAFFPSQVTPEDAALRAALSKAIDE